MKRIYTLIVCLLMLAGCSGSKQSDYEVKYFDMIELISERNEFLTSSNSFTISYDISKIEGDKYRYYVIIDNPNIAMYDVEAIAIESGVDYSTSMAANISIFDDTQYNLVPNQVYTEKYYYEGLSISGVSDSANPTLYVLVQWKNKSLADTRREFFKLEIR